MDAQMKNAASVRILNYLEVRRAFFGREIARILGISPSEIVRIRKGQRDWTFAQVLALADHLKIPPAVLLLDACRDIDNFSLNEFLRDFLNAAIKVLDREPYTVTGTQRRKALARAGASDRRTISALEL